MVHLVGYTVFLMGKNASIGDNIKFVCPFSRNPEFFKLSDWLKNWHHKSECLTIQQSVNLC